MKKISMQLLTDYDAIQVGIMLKWSEEVDLTDVYMSESGEPYYRVLTQTIQSIADARALISKALTGYAFDTIYYTAFGDNFPIYLENNGKLYVRNMIRGGVVPVDWQWDQLVFTNVTADSFTVEGTYDGMGSMSSETFDIVRTEAGFRIANIS